MKILKNRTVVAFLLSIFILLFFGSCEKKSDLIEFTLVPVATEALPLDNTIDTLINGLGYYSDTLLLNNNFFRSACEENGVNTIDVESVFLESSQMEIVAPPNSASPGQFLGSVTQVFLNPAGQPDTIAEAAFDGNSIPGNLELRPVNLKAYFDNLATTMPVFFGAGDSSLPETFIKYNLRFKVRGYTH